MIAFNIYRHESDGPAADCEMGDLEFIIDNKTISSRGESRYLNMIYISIFDMIDGLLKLNTGSRNYEFVGADSSFIIKFEKNKSGVYLHFKKQRLGPLPLRELLFAIDRGIDSFISDPLNALPAGSDVHGDFTASLRALKEALA